MNNKLILAAAALLVACDGGGKDTGSDGTFSPEEGEWYAGEQVVVSDACGIFDDGGPGDTGDEGDEPAILTRTGDGTFSLTGTGDDGFSTNCTLSGYDFACEATVEEEDYSGKGLDALLSSSYAYTGSFSSETAGTLNIGVEISCAGKDCAKFEGYLEISLPCAASLEADISHGG